MGLVIKRNAVRKAEDLVVRHEPEVDEFRFVNTAEKAFMGEMPSQCSPEAMRSYIESLALEMFQMGYRQARNDVRNFINFDAD